MYKLCYVEMPWCYFTDKEIEEQQGDGWHQKPYHYYAGEPYENEPGQILKVAIDNLGYEMPDQNYSVNEINKGLCAWMYIDSETIIHAGTSLEDFCKIIKEIGGRVYRHIPDVITVKFGDIPPNILENQTGRIVCE